MSRSANIMRSIYILRAIKSGQNWPRLFYPKESQTGNNEKKWKWLSEKIRESKEILTERFSRTKLARLFYMKPYLTILPLYVEYLRTSFFPPFLTFSGIEQSVCVLCCVGEVCRVVELHSVYY